MKPFKKIIIGIILLFGSFLLAINSFYSASTFTTILVTACLIAGLILVLMGIVQAIQNVLNKKEKD